jgi:flagellum-specific peptidoglycan hydrolase FlgJ
MRSREEKLTWLKSLVPDAQRAAKEWPGMRVAVCLAQAALESSFGERMIGKGNLWGIKRLAWIPGVIKVKTKEWMNGEFVSCAQEFADFPSIYEGMRCYGRLLTNSPTYQSARESADLEDYVAEVSKHWATDPLYRKKVWTLIQLSELERLDG